MTIIFYTAVFMSPLETGLLAEIMFLGIKRLFFKEKFLRWLEGDAAEMCEKGRPQWLTPTWDCASFQSFQRLSASSAGSAQYWGARLWDGRFAQQNDTTQWSSNPMRRFCKPRFSACSDLWARADVRIMRGTNARSWLTAVRSQARTGLTNTTFCLRGTDIFWFG